MKIQLFVPPQGYVAQRWEGGSMPPLGILYLAAVLEQAGHDVQVVPADILCLSWTDIADTIRSFGPRLVGITTTTENRFDSFRLCRLAKEVDPTIATVMGGPHISMAKADTMEHLSAVDFLVIGEGEETLVELVTTLENKADPSRVKGLYYRSGGQVVFSGTRPFRRDLDGLPMPARHLVDIDKYNFRVQGRDGRWRKAQNMMTSRGCPFDCYFCATPVNWGRAMRGLSPEKVIAEVEYLVKHYQAEYIWFYDDTFNYNVKRLEAIMDLILERDLNIRFACEFRIDHISRPLLAKMRRAGLETGFFGIEAGNSRVRREVVHKQFDLDKAFQFVAWAKELDFTANAFFIFSHDTETWQEAQETIAIMERLQAINPEVEITTAILHVYPGTPLEDLARRKGIVPKDFSWTRKQDMRRVYVLPAAQGYVPLYKDRLTWRQIAELVMRWSATRKKVLSSSKVKQALRTLNSWRNLGVYAVFFLVMMKHKLKNKLPAWFRPDKKG